VENRSSGEGASESGPARGGGGHRLGCRQRAGKFQRSLDFYLAASSDGASPGSTCAWLRQVPALQRALEENRGPRSKYDPFRKITVDEHKFDMASFSSTRPRLRSRWAWLCVARGQAVIHINLLPIRKGQAGEASQRQFVYMGVAILARCRLSSCTCSHRSARRNQAQEHHYHGGRSSPEAGNRRLRQGSRSARRAVAAAKTIQALDSGGTGQLSVREMSEILSPARAQLFDRVTYEETLGATPTPGSTQVGMLAAYAGGYSESRST